MIRRLMKLPAKDPVSRRVGTLSLRPSMSCCDVGEMKKGMSSGSMEPFDEFRLHSCIPFCFFAECVVSADAAGFEDVDDDEEDDEEEEEEEDLDTFGMNLAFGSTFNNFL